MESTPGDAAGGGATPPLTLDADRIVETVARLHRRIEERFPGSGLARLCLSLQGIGEGTKRRIEEVQQPYLWLRLGTGVLVVLVVIGLVAAVRSVLVAIPTGVDTVFSAIQVLESGIQDVVFVGLAVAFLVTLETRLRRRRALRYIRELRAVAHIVDMHQLTKDPDRLLGLSLPDTESSPRRTLDRFELGRYLDYCSEMLSLTSKLAALYAECFDDQVVLQAVDEVEALTTGLSGRIWQKIMILDVDAGAS